MKKTIFILLISLLITGNSRAQTNAQSLVSIADLKFDKVLPKHQYGMPVGNGRMGSLVWISNKLNQSKLKLQINRVDVFGSNSYSAVHELHTDYSGACGFVEIGFNSEPFIPGKTMQHLNVYDALMTASGKDFKVRVLAYNQLDIMAIEIDDSRDNPADIDIDLKMIRPDKVQTGKHLAVSELHMDDRGLILNQEFTEPSESTVLKGDHYCASSVAVRVIGRESKAIDLNNSTSRLTVKGSSGKFTILIGSSADLSRETDINRKVVQDLDAAEQIGFEGLLESNTEWWHEFWEKSYIWTPDNPEFTRLWVYYLYLSNSTMRGKYPAQFNGQIWSTMGDVRKWGARYWWWNQGCMHSSFDAANHMELNDPLFNMRTNAYPAYEKAARQDWNSKGIFIPETGTFDGPEELPEDIAEEIRKVFIDEKLPSEKLKAYMQKRNQFESRWSLAKPDIPVGWVSHVMVVAAKTADLYWKRYEYTLDEDWLRDRAYPMLRGAAEFYRNYPNLKKDTDGKYHIYNTALHEHLWGAKDVVDDLSLMNGLFPTLIRASEILHVDEDMRPKWQEIVDNLAPYPTNETPDALGTLKHKDGLTTLARGIGPTYLERGTGSESPRLRMVEQFDVVTLESHDNELRELVMATYEAHPGYKNYHNGVEGSGSSRFPVIAARLGRSDDMEVYLPMWLNQFEGSWDTPNGLAEKEGEEAYSVQAYGIFSDAIQQSLCQSLAPSSDEKSIIRVFPAWPKKWDAAFKLLCKGGFLVSSSMKKGIVEYVEIHSQIGGECKIRNPWTDAEVLLKDDHDKTEVLKGQLLLFETEKGETIILSKTE